MSEEIVIGQEKPKKKTQKKKVKEVPKERRQRVIDEKWLPADLISIPEKYKDPNFTYACFDQYRPGRIRQKQNEGWEVDLHIVPQMRTDGYFDHIPATIQDGLPKDDTLQFRELLVMRLHNSRAKARQAYLDSKDPLHKRLQVEDDALHDRTGGRSYGDIKIKKGE